MMAVLASTLVTVAANFQNGFEKRVSASHALCPTAERGPTVGSADS